MESAKKLSGVAQEIVQVSDEKPAMGGESTPRKSQKQAQKRRKTAFLGRMLSLYESIGSRLSYDLRTVASTLVM
jgi:hypothetical protein